MSDGHNRRHDVTLTDQQQEQHRQEQQQQERRESRRARRPTAAAAAAAADAAAIAERRRVRALAGRDQRRAAGANTRSPGAGARRAAATSSHADAATARSRRPASARSQEEARASSVDATDNIEQDPTLGPGIISRAERDTLLAYYYNIDEPYALTSSPRRLLRALQRRLPDLTLRKCRFFLQSQSPYTLTAPKRRPSPSNPMEVYRCFDVLACLRAMLSRYFAFCLTIIHSTLAQHCL